jgi:tetratricopeptide (TPR) repeat protein
MMSDNEDKPDDCEQQLDAIIAEYYRSAEKGEAPDPGHFMARYPDFQEELSEFFAHLGMFQHSGSSNEEIPCPKPTIIDRTSPRKNLAAEARPVRLSDRAYRWARRHPWVAATAALVCLIWIAGPLFPHRQATLRFEAADNANLAAMEANRASQAAKLAEIRMCERTDPAFALERIRGDDIRNRREKESSGRQDIRTRWEAASNHVKNKQFSEARLILQGLIDEAKQQTQNPGKVIARVPYPLSTASLYRKLAALESNARRPEASRATLLELAGLFESGMHKDNTENLRSLADLWFNLGRLDDAARAYEQLLSIAGKSAMIPELGQFTDYLPTDDFRILTQLMRSRQLKPAAIEGKRVEDTPMYRARYERWDGRYYYYWGISEADFRKHSVEIKQEGLVMVQHFSFPETADKLHCAIWEFPRPSAALTRIEGESLDRIAWTSGDVSEQSMTDFKASTWSGDKQLLWINGAKDDELKVGFQVETTGRFAISAVFTTAFDYGIVDLYLDEQIMSEALDLFRPGDISTVNTLEHPLGAHLLKAGKHQIRIVLKGSHPDAVNHHGFGMDYVSFQQVGESETIGR